MPKKGSKKSVAGVSDKERQVIGVVLLEARASLPNNSIPTSEQHATIKKNLIPALHKLRDEGIFPAGANMEVLEGALGQIEGLAAMNKCTKLKCDIRDHADKLWDTINKCLAVGGVGWKTGHQLPDVIHSILEALWDEKEQLRVGASQERNGEDPLSPGAKPGAKPTKPAQKYVAGCWLGPPWWLAFLRFWSPHGTNPAVWCVNPKTDIGPGGAIPKGKKEGGSRQKDRAKCKQDVATRQAHSLKEYHTQRKAAGGSDGDKEMLAALSDTRRAISLNTLEGKLATTRKELQRAVHYAGELEWKLDQIEMKSVEDGPAPVAVLDRIAGRWAAAVTSRDEIQSRVSDCEAEIVNFYKPPTVNPHP